MRDALLELGTPQRQHSIDETPRSRRAKNTLRPVAALMPARNHELKQVDNVVGMKMGKKDRVERASGRPRRDEALGRAGAAIDQKCVSIMAHQIRGAKTLGIALRTARAEQC